VSRAGWPVDAAASDPAPDAVLVDRMTIEHEADRGPLSAGQRPGPDPGADDADATSRATADERAAQPDDGDQLRGDRPPASGEATEPADADRTEIERLQDQALELWGRLVPAPEAVRRVSDANGNARVLRILVATAQRNLANRDRAA
jgi:hypothetical protein